MCNEMKKDWRNKGTEEGTPGQIAGLEPGRACRPERYRVERTPAAKEGWVGLSAWSLPTIPGGQGVFIHSTGRAQVESCLGAPRVAAGWGHGLRTNPEAQAPLGSFLAEQLQATLVSQGPARVWGLR